jgi:hypothetical protein
MSEQFPAENVVAADLREGAFPPPTGLDPITEFGIDDARQQAGFRVRGVPSETRFEGRLRL